MDPISNVQPATDGKIKRWLLEHRTTVRLAFALNLFSRATSSVMSLIWTRLLVHTMGKSLYGLFISFQALPSLGGLGDLGIGGAVAVRTGQMLGRGEQERLREFLAAARTLFFLLAPVMGLVFLGLSPWLRKWFGFEGVPEAGSMPMLFAMGAVALTIMIGGGYFHNLNPATGTVTWQVIPLLLFAQSAMLVQWLLARQGVPLWMQFLPYIGMSGLNTIAVWLMVRAAFPRLSEIFPLKVDWKLWRELLTASGWMYLFTLGNMVFIWTARLVVNAGFGAAAVTPYTLNYKPCEIALQVVLSATFVSLPKLNMWLANPSLEIQNRARTEGQRLNIFQSVVGTGCALGYLALINLFMQHWMGPDYEADPYLQSAFALTLAVCTSGDAGVQISGVAGPKGLRTTGLTIGLTAALNVALSVLAMKMKFLLGIALATVVAQSVLSLTLSWYATRRLSISFSKWTLRSWLLPVVMVLAGAGLRRWVGSSTWTQAGILLSIFLGLWLIHARVAGLSLEMLRSEFTFFRRFLPGKKS